MPAQQLIKPTNQILVYGDKKIIEMKVGSLATVAQMVPGRLVIRDAADNEVKEAGAGAKNFLGIIDVDPTHDIDDTYALGDNLPIIVPTSDTFLKLLLLANENVTQGDELIVAANGKVSKAIDIEVAAGAVAVTSTAANGAIVTGSVLPGGKIVGDVWESSNIAEDAWVIVKMRG